MKTILIPTDFSENARNAAVYAISLFGENARFILMNSYSMPSHHNAAMLINLDEELANEANSQLKKELKKLSDSVNTPALQLSLRAESGKLTSAIEYVCRKEEVDYVVMGTKGADGLEELFIGSNSYDVAIECTRPVIIVPDNAQFSGLKNVIYTADYDESYLQKEDDAVIDLISSHKANFSVLNISDSEDSSVESDEAIEKLAERFKVLSPSFHKETNTSIAEGIGKFVDEKDADMVVMVARESGFFDTIFRKSITRKITLHTSVPVLVINNRD